MKKIALSLIIILLATSAVKAQNRSESEMKAIAARQLFGTQAKAYGNRSQSDLVNVLSCDEYSIFSAGENGFAVISKNIHANPVLGYSFTPYNQENVPCGMEWWLEAVKESLKAEKTSNWNETTSVVPPATPSFVTTKWGQGQPYNNLTPFTSSGHAPTGCMATAMSQIMKYFRYPAQGKGTGYYKNAEGTNRIGAINSVYDWDNMKDRYLAFEVKSMTDEQKKPIATLMYEAGLSSQMDYSSDGSGAYDSDAAWGLVANFQYDSLALHNYQRTFYSDDEWMNLVYNELKNKRPILYCGADSKAGGHAFVLDGIDENGLVSVNWGWDGSSDGFYDINVLAASGTGYSFRNHQSMIFGFKAQEKPDSDEKYESIWACNDRYELSAPAMNRLEVSKISDIYNYQFLIFYGKLGLFFKNKDNPDSDYEIIFYDTSVEGNGEIDPRYGFTASTLSSMLIKNPYDLTSLKPGTYTVFIGSKAMQETEPSHLRCPGGIIEYKLTKEANGTITLSDPEVVTDINSLTTTNHYKSSNAWYTINGQRLNAEPTQRGIYIHNGKKVVK